MKQKNIFMKAEGNNFFERNKNNLPNHNIRFIENFILKISPILYVISSVPT